MRFSVLRKPHSSSRKLAHSLDCMIIVFPSLTFTKFLENFFTESDALFFRSLGLNCIRIAVNYKHLEGVFTY